MKYAQLIFWVMFVAYTLFKPIKYEAYQKLKYIRIEQLIATTL